MHEAARLGDVQLVDELLAVNSALIDAVDNTGCTPLHIAVEKEHLDVVDLLLARGAAINAKTKAGETSLNLAAYEGKTAVAARLLRFKPNLELENTSGFRPLEAAVEQKQVDWDTLLKRKAWFRRSCLATLRLYGGAKFFEFLFCGCTIVSAGRQQWDAAADAVSLYELP